MGRRGSLVHTGTDIGEYLSFITKSIITSPLLLGVLGLRTVMRVDCDELEGCVHSKSASSLGSPQFDRPFDLLFCMTSSNISYEAL